jgi:hypothetical protein
VCGEDLLSAAAKLGVGREEIVSMLDKSGFYQSQRTAFVRG